MLDISAHSHQIRDYNEDFYFEKEIAGRNIFVVGDFAPTEYTGVDSLARRLLEKQGDGILASVPTPILLAHIATHLNNDLFNYHTGFKKSFQCSVAFTALAGPKMYHLCIGDCYVSVKRNDYLILLNSSVWVDKTGNPLTGIITSNQEMRRGNEPPPQDALGIRQKEIPASAVQSFDLQAGDVILLYSDGVDKVISPAQLLQLVTTKDAHEGAGDRVKRILSEVQKNRGDDDSTLLIAIGDYKTTQDIILPAWFTEAQTRIDREFEGLREYLLSVRREDQASFIDIARVAKTREESVEKSIRQISERLEQVPTGIREHISTILTPIADTPNQIKIEVLRLLDGFSEKLHDLGKAISSINEDKKDAQKNLDRVEENIGEILRLANGFTAKVTPSSIEEMRKDLRDIHELVLRLDKTKEEAAPVNKTEDPAQATSNQTEPMEAITSVRGDAGFNDATTQVAAQTGHHFTYAKEHRRTSDFEEEQQPETKKTQAKPMRLSLIQELDLKSDRWREGVIHVNKDRKFALIDEEDIRALCDDGGEDQNRFLSATDDVPPGWLTAWYLNRQNAERPQRVDTFENTVNWLMEQSEGFAENIPPELLLRLREWHWQLRDYRRKRGIKSPQTDQYIGEGEKSLSGIVTDALNNKEVNVGGFKLPNAPLMRRKLFDKPVIRYLIYVLTFAVTIALLLLPIWLLNPKDSRNKNANSSTNSNSRGGAEAENLRISFGGDGRTLLLNGVEPLGYRIEFGKERDFKQLVSTIEGFNDLNGARQWLETETVRQLIVKSGSRLQLPPKVGVYPVLQSDVSGEQTCTNFLERVNLSLREGVHTTESQFRELNSGVDCTRLKKGDELLVYVQPAG